MIPDIVGKNGLQLDINNKVTIEWGVIKKATSSRYMDYTITMPLKMTTNYYYINVVGNTNQDTYACGITNKSNTTFIIRNLRNNLGSCTYIIIGY